MKERDLLLKCVELAKEKKAFDILSMEIKGISVIADYFLLLSASNPTQARAICDYVDDEMSQLDRPPLRKEGYGDARWIILDFGGLLLHIFQPLEREYYNLERLWADAPVERF